MMALGTARPASPRSRRLAKVGCMVGLVIALGLSARIIQVQVFRPEGSPSFGVIYSGILLGPFAASTAALRSAQRRRQLNVWGASGLIACVTAWMTVTGVTLPLLIPGGLLLAAAATGDADR